VGIISHKTKETGMSERTPGRLTLADLEQFCGSTEYHKHWSGMLFTDGILYLAETAGAHWLVDIVASYQSDKRVRSNKRLREFQLWELSVANGQGVVLLREDSGEPAVLSQEIEYTDFPLESIKLYVEGGVILLPSEH
jgi:hypothetical protein